jgi:hypothetical protein
MSRSGKAVAAATALNAEVAVIRMTSAEVDGPPAAVGGIHKIGMAGRLHGIPPRRML